MAGEAVLDPVTASLLTTHALNGAQNLSNGAAFVAEAARTNFLEGKLQVGTREAQAMQETRTSAQAREVLQARAASGQPGGT